MGVTTRRIAVIVVDTDAGRRAALTRMLEEGGVAPFPAASPQLAKEILGVIPCKVVVVAPGTDGAVLGLAVPPDRYGIFRRARDGSNAAAGEVEPGASLARVANATVAEANRD